MDDDGRTRTVGLRVARTQNPLTESNVALVLVLEPDARQRKILRWVIEDRLSAEFIVADSKEAAVTAMASRIPDLILVSALISPRDEVELGDYFRELHGAEHMQTLTIPLLGNLDSEAKQDKPTGFLKSFRRKQKPAKPTGYDPAAYADELKTYLRPALEARSARDRRPSIPVIDALPDTAPPVIDEVPVERYATPSAMESPFALVSPVDAVAQEFVQPEAVEEDLAPSALFSQPDHAESLSDPDRTNSIEAAQPVDPHIATSTDEDQSAETDASATQDAELIRELAAYDTRPEPTLEMIPDYEADAPEAPDALAPIQVDHETSLPEVAAAVEPGQIAAEAIVEPDADPLKATALMAAVAERIEVAETPADDNTERREDVFDPSSDPEVLPDPAPVQETPTLEVVADESPALPALVADDVPGEEPEAEPAEIFAFPPIADIPELDPIVEEIEQHQPTARVAEELTTAAEQDEPEVEEAPTPPLAEKVDVLSASSAAKLLEEQLAALLASDLELAPQLIQIPPDEAEAPDAWATTDSVAAVVEDLIRPMSEAVEPSESMVVEVVQGAGDWPEEQRRALDATAPPVPDEPVKPAEAVAQVQPVTPAPEKAPVVEAWLSLPDWSNPWPALGSYISVSVQPPASAADAAGKDAAPAAPVVEAASTAEPGPSIDGDWLARAFNALRSDIQLLRQPAAPDSPPTATAQPAQRTQPSKKATIQKRRHLKKRPDKRIRDWGLTDGVFLTVDAFLASDVMPRSKGMLAHPEQDWAGGSRRGWLAPWVRSEASKPSLVEPLPQTAADDLRVILSDLDLPVAVASMTYPTGCQIQRIRMNRGKRSRRSKPNEPVIILSRTHRKSDDKISEEESATSDTGN